MSDIGPPLPHAACTPSRSLSLLPSHSLVLLLITQDQCACWKLYQSLVLPSVMLCLSACRNFLLLYPHSAAIVLAFPKEIATQANVYSILPNSNWKSASVRQRA